MAAPPKRIEKRSSSSSLQAGKPRRRVSHLSLTKTRAGKRKRRKAVEMRGRAGGQASIHTSDASPRSAPRWGNSSVPRGGLRLEAWQPPRARGRPPWTCYPRHRRWTPAASIPSPSRRGAKQTIHTHKKEKGKMERKRKERTSGVGRWPIGPSEKLGKWGSVTWPRWLSMAASECWAELPCRAELG